MRPGDVIVVIDGTKIESATDLYLAMERYKVGDTVTVGVLRGGKTMQLKATLEAVDEAGG